ncbi:bifunctional riboflavin kinase/FAD synthetase [Sodalis endosymbiont of Henestaris halophilus]|uniref:bifunctional riboflavin kinase/FAD synthetase n=1 Tax=Sodalis endosymbiont of Henestaris halophilus TaxID=1929246 RepID=UPI000BC08D7D|nr:bifunctional riboflavin kinase/FAD synthetase [Sodalis endosymbiont of Henestaris halophilus]SNC58568.1 Riboflavin biosynthesis protein RibF [Sodalis endosymbiont of Henestaris halophilus]
MELIRGIHNLRPRHHGCVLTIGNFDGFHRGHQALIAKLKTEGSLRCLPVMVMIFEPQPQEYFASDSAPARLTPLRDKIKYFKAAGVNTIICITFNKRFAAISACDFITDLLVQKLGVRLISIGDDFRFGAQRLGSYALLQQAGKAAGFEVISTVTYTEKGRRISSTAVREALKHDRLMEAEMLMGHTYRLSGRVVHGDAMGRSIGFPTANVSLKSRAAPIHGVYAVEVYSICLASQPLPGVANIGTRPTVDGLRQRLEVHLMDVVINLYGSHIEVVIREKLRNEKRFKSLDDLKRQIANDVMHARDYFGLAIF